MPRIVTALHKPNHEVLGNGGGATLAEGHESADTVGAVDRPPRSRGGVERNEEIAGKKRPHFTHEAAAAAARLPLYRAKHRKALAGEIMLSDVELVWAHLR